MAEGPTATKYNYVNRFIPSIEHNVTRLLDILLCSARVRSDHGEQHWGDAGLLDGLSRTEVKEGEAAVSVAGSNPNSIYIAIISTSENQTNYKQTNGHSSDGIPFRVAGISVYVNKMRYGKISCRV